MNIVSVEEAGEAICLLKVTQWRQVHNKGHRSRGSWVFGSKIDPKIEIPRPTTHDSRPTTNTTRLLFQESGFLFEREVNAVNRAQKEEVVEKLREELQDAKSIIMTNHMGIDVNTINELRSDFRSEDVEYHVVKNTLAKIAVSDTELEELGEHFTGPTALAYSFEDAVAPAKVIDDFAEDHEEFEVKGGYLDGKVIDPDEIEQLADMPTKDELRSKFLSTLKAVPSNFVRLLQAGPKQFLNVLNNRKQSIEE